MEFNVGAVMTGKVTGITKFGAFVALAPGKSGLVHISEIANSFVSDIHEFLTEGQEVSVKIINIDETGRINLSIKQAQEPVRTREPEARQKREPRSTAEALKRSDAEANYAPKQSSNASFEDKLKRFMQDSDSKISGIRQYSEKKTSRRRGKNQ